MYVICLGTSLWLYMETRSSKTPYSAFQLHSSETVNSSHSAAAENQTGLYRNAKVTARPLMTNHFLKIIIKLCKRRYGEIFCTEMFTSGVSSVRALYAIKYGRRFFFPHLTSSIIQ
ncbi:hypothetical protein AMELA_G00219860 [Ameiurus melas]|uniref:Uncharacterized protein n=1 Tax=Ameiurus melas TaxID=219545 RepID=A0A7J6A1U1_AMEME|nr:hypothetical protein AMELA_G00219860 [Ameiurus melas]